MKVTNREFGLLPCEYGPSFYCNTGKHENCTHRYGGCHHHGSPSPEGYLVSGPGEHATVVYDQGQPVALLPMHVWRCSCDCHGDAATDLLELLR